MDLTRSYETAFLEPVRLRYDWRETRNAGAVLAATDPAAFRDIAEVLQGFTLTTHDLIYPGGNETDIAARLNEQFRRRGWREAAYGLGFVATRTTEPFGGEPRAEPERSEISSEGYKVDNVLRRVVLDVEWNAKDGNLDRDLAAYRALYDAGFVDVAIILTRVQVSLRQFAYRLALENGIEDAEARKRLATTTTTNLEKLEPRLSRGDGGGCPVLAVAITERCWAE